MSYTPTVWEDGDVITDVKLNNIESGIANVTETAETLTETLETELSTKADNNGYYQDMTVGDAEQLVSTISTEDKVPYLFRTSGGSIDIGNRETDTIIGGTVAWNQLFERGGVLTKPGVTIIDNNDGSFTMNGTSTGRVQINSLVNSQRFVENHVFLFSITNVSGTRTGHMGMFCYGRTSSGGGSYPSVQIANEEGTVFRPDNILKMTTTVSILGRVVDFSTTGSEFTNFKFTPQIFDLTQMFGATIADYIYSLEQATAGAGVAWFKKLFPKDYYEYNAGELLSVEGLQSHDMMGFNLASEVYNGTSATQYVRCLYAKAQLLPDTVYCISFVGATGNKFYFSEDLFDTTATPWGTITATGERQSVLAKTKHNLSTSNAGQYDSNMGWSLLKNGAGNTVVPNFTDVCINLSWSGAHDGEYEAYEKHSYPLDSSLTLRGIPKLDASNNLYYDGDTYESDGTVTRKYGIVDLGTLTWQKFSVTQGTLFRTTISTSADNDSTITANAICAKYPTVAQTSRAEKTLNSIGHLFDIIDSSYTTEQDFKTAMSGVYLVYELAEPTEETAEPYTNPQIVNDWGTEEYVTDSIVPVGHDTKYGANLRDKLQHLPDLASGDGVYVINQTGAQMSLTPLSTPTELPAAPTTDGTYALKCTVADGAATYTWEAE